MSKAAFFNTWDLPVYRGELIDLGNSGVGWIASTVFPGQVAPMGMMTPEAMRGEEMPEYGRTVLDRIDPAFPRRPVKRTRFGEGPWMRCFDIRDEVLSRFDTQCRFAREMSVAMQMIGDLALTESQEIEPPRQDCRMGIPMGGNEMGVVASKSLGFTVVAQ